MGNNQSPVDIDKTNEFHRGYLVADMTGFSNKTETSVEYNWGAKN